MKSFYLAILLFLSASLFSQNAIEKSINSEIEDVCVFIDAAQITRQKTITLNKGKFTLKFVKLSPFIDSKSIRISSKGNVMVLSVNHQQNYLDKMKKSAETIDLEQKLENLIDKITTENTYLSVINDEINFLRNNKTISGKNEAVSLSSLQQISSFYGKRIAELKLKETERRKNINKLNLKKIDLQKQLNNINSNKKYPSGEILVKVDAKTSGNFTFKLSYLVKNAGWFPSYDVRVDDINSPVKLIYKANVKQDTKVDWKNVKLTFSSAEPNVSNIVPKLKTYFLNYHTLPPTYNLQENKIYGIVTNTFGKPLNGANIHIKGTTIATFTDDNGYYSINIPNENSQLIISCIGYNSKIVGSSYGKLNIRLQQENLHLNNANMRAYKTENKKTLSAYNSEPLYANMEDMDDEIEEVNESPIIEVEQKTAQTNVNFAIKMPYTIKSDNKNYTVTMKQYSIPANYQYFCVPKVKQEAYLIANITNFINYNLLDAETNIFFENTFVGKSIIDLQNTNDTLKISLGKDKQVYVKREEVQNVTNKQFIGNKKEKTKDWKTIIKNNKNQAINIIVQDQVPVSSNTEIEINIHNKTGAKFNSKTGKVEWKLTLKSKERKELNLEYSVKYPKNKHLIIE